MPYKPLNASIKINIVINNNNSNDLFIQNINVF